MLRKNPQDHPSQLLYLIRFERKNQRVFSWNRRLLLEKQEEFAGDGPIKALPTTLIGLFKQVQVVNGARAPREAGAAASRAEATQHDAVAEAIVARRISVQLCSLSSGTCVIKGMVVCR